MTRRPGSLPSLLPTAWARVAIGAVAGALAALLAVTAALAAPKVVIISLDGATPRFVDQYLASGALGPHTGLGLLQEKGITARQNVTISPSLTAPGHIAIATGSRAANNDIVANTFHLVASPFIFTISGFAAPIGGYSIDGPAASPVVTAEPVWLGLRAARKTVVAATFPGADGLDVRVPGVPNSPIVQPAAERTVDYTVPFGAFAGVGAQGFSLTAADFGPAPAATVQQLAAAGRMSFSPVRQKLTPLEQFSVGGASHTIQVAALDTTDDGQTNYDTLAFFEATRAIPPGPFSLPSTGPAYVRAADKKSSLFFLEGSSNRAGTGFYVSRLAPDLSEIRIARYSANAIPRNLPVLTDVDDINEHVGFWAPQPDFRIPERLSPGFGPFPDPELEAIYQDLVRLFVDYQTRVGLRAISRFPDADLVMIYIEQPDGSGHQFLLTDPRQPTDFTNPASIGAGQDPAKVARYAAYVQSAYQVASDAVQRIIEAVGTDAAGVPRSNIIVVSDHGFETFHTAVSMNNFLAARGFNPATVRAITSGPAVNIYINLRGRQPNGTVSPEEYVALRGALVDALKAFVDTNPHYMNGQASVPVFDKVYARPVPANLDDPSFGRGTDEFIGQDSGDVFALLTVGYNFDGTQIPVVRRLGDPPSAAPLLSLPNFYGAHGYDPTLPHMSAIFTAAGPDIRQGTLTRVSNIDVAPTAARLLGVKLSTLVEGKAIPVRMPRAVKATLAAQLAALLPSADRRSRAHLERAVERFSRGLAAPLWVDDAHLTRLGARVFQEERAGVDHLLKIVGPLPAVRPVIEGIVTVDEELAAIAIDEAMAAGGDERLIRLARQALDGGMAEAAADRYRQAIDQYRNAWGLARKAAKAQVDD